MNTTPATPPGHLEDGVLMGYMDHGLDLAARRRADGHLARCAACRERLDALRGAAGGAAAWLSALDAPVPEARRDAARAAMERARFRGRPANFEGRGALAAAAVAVLALTLSFGTAPGRAWIGDAAARLGIGARPGPLAEDGGDAAAAGAQGPEGSRAAAVEAEETPSLAPRAATGARSAAPPPGTSHPVHFEPAGNYVLIRFDSRQRTGTAAIWVRDEPRASGQIVSGRRSESLVPASDGLVVRNHAASGADYTIVVPTRYRVLRVRVGDEPETRIPITRSGQDWLWSLNLAGAPE